MAKIVRRPELRYTQDNQTPYAQMLVEFSPNRAEATPTNLRAVAWGNLASEVAQNYNEGDQVILEGRLSMQTIDRPEGFKEKRAELVISHLYHLDGSVSSGEMAAPTPEKVVPINTNKSSKLNENSSLEFSQEVPLLTWALKIQLQRFSEHCNTCQSRHFAKHHLKVLTLTLCSVFIRYCNNLRC